MTSMNSSGPILASVTAAATLAFLLHLGWSRRARQQETRCAVPGRPHYNMVLPQHGCEYLQGYATDAHVQVVTTVHECNAALKELMRDSKTQRTNDGCGAHPTPATPLYLGVDAEWTTAQDGTRNKIALLQVASETRCVLIHLSELVSGADPARSKLPAQLVRLLKSPTVFKVGVGITRDAEMLFDDYQLVIRSCVEVGPLSEKIGLMPSRTGLRVLAERVAAVTIRKDTHVRCSNWNTDILSSDQVAYAAADALVAHCIFKALLNHPGDQKCPAPIVEQWERSEIFRTLIVDVVSVNPRKARTKRHQPNDSAALNKNGADSQAATLLNLSEKKWATRREAATKKPVYGNGIMLAPDGTTLCRCGVKKIQWYLREQLADLIEESPNMVIKLRFLPKSQEANDHYNTAEKKNECVRCGGDDALSRFHVVPRCYRQHFPENMKSHTHHDVLLLCVQCHLVASQGTQKMQATLALEYCAPLNVPEPHRDSKLSAMKAKRAACALMGSGDRIPADRRAVLMQEVRLYYCNSEDDKAKSDEDLILCGSTLQPNDTQEASQRQEFHTAKHGNVVVRKLLMNKAAAENELANFVKLWRNYFLDSLQPKYMPAHWDVNHRTANHSPRRHFRDQCAGRASSPYPLTNGPDS